MIKIYFLTLKMYEPISPLIYFQFIQTLLFNYYLFVIKPEQI